MATIKAYTDINQSRELAKILPTESADMYYQYVLPKSSKIKHNPEMGNPVSALKWYNKGYTMSGKEPITLDEYCVPCWSLTALYSVLPTIDNEFEPQLHRSLDKYRCTYEGEDDSSGLWRVADNPIDACYEMILKLHELKML